VNIREQCSWTHTDDHLGATEKAARVVRAGIARTRLTEPLDPHRGRHRPCRGGHRRGHRRPARRAGLAEIGLAVHLVERTERLGGWVGGFAEKSPHG
jgi:heterodisulfide reductase subunit A